MVSEFADFPQINETEFRHITMVCIKVVRQVHTLNTFQKKKYEIMINKEDFFIVIVLGFNDTSTLVGHFVSSPREREKRDRRDSRRDEREGQGRKRNRNESEDIAEIKTFPLYPYLLQG